MKWLAIILMVFVLSLTVVSAFDYQYNVTEKDKEAFKAILEPVMKIYNFIKYASSAIALIFLLFAGIQFMSSGNDPTKREQAKHMAGYVILGLAVIWAAPFIVDYLVQ